MRASWRWCSSLKSWRRMADQIAWTTVLGQAFTSDRRRGVCQHPEIEAAGEERRDAEELATAGGRNQDHVSRPGSDRHRARPIRRSSTSRNTTPRWSTPRLRRRWSSSRKTMTLTRRSRLASSGSPPGSRLARRWTTTTTTVRTDCTAAATCYTTPGTTTTTIGKTLARTGRITARTSSRSAAIARRTDRSSGPSAPARPRSSARTVNRRGRKIDRVAGATNGAARRHKARRPRARRHRHRRSGRTGSAEARGYGDGSRSQAAKPSATSGGSDAFSGYSSGQSQRSSSARGQQSRGSSRSRGGGGRRR